MPSLRQQRLRRHWPRLLLFGWLLAWAPQNASAQTLAPLAAGASIDWGARQLLAQGVGRAPTPVVLLREALPLAEEAAYAQAVDAMRQSLLRSEVLPAPIANAWRAALRGQTPGAIGGQSVLARMLAPGARVSPSGQRDETERWLGPIVAAIERALQGARAAQVGYGADGSVKLTAALPLDGGADGLGEAWLLWRRQQTRGMPTGPIATSQPPDPADPAGALAREVTGFVIEARGLSVRPSLWPRIGVANEAGPPRTIYSADWLADEMLRRTGVASYVHSTQAALRDPRVADKASIVRAQRLWPGDDGAVVVSADDAEAMQSAAHVLHEGRVLFVID